MKDENEALEVCQVINFIEDDALFGCLEPIKYKIILEGLGIEAISCQRHAELFKSEAEKKGILNKIKLVDITDDDSKE